MINYNKRKALIITKLFNTVTENTFIDDDAVCRGVLHIKNVFEEFVFQIGDTYQCLRTIR